MLRNAILVVALYTLFSSASFAVGDESDEIRKQFTQAQSLAAQGQTAQAVTAYETLIRSNPAFPEAYNNLAALYLQENKTKKAKHILEQGLHAHKGYGVLYESLTAINMAMAREAYSKALQIDLNSSPISIASLSLSNNKAQPNKNTIVISKTEPPIVEKNKLLEPKTINENKPIKAVIKTKPVAEIKVVNTNAAKKSSSQSVKNVLRAWSSAWSAQATDMYLSFYHQKYKPTNGLSRKGWEQSRRYRLKKPRWIKVGLSNFDIRKQSMSQAVVNFKQKYQSNIFKDVSYKQVVLLNTGDGWRIFRENNL